MPRLTPVSWQDISDVLANLTQKEDPAPNPSPQARRGIRP